MSFLLLILFSNKRGISKIKILDFLFFFINVLSFFRISKWTILIILVKFFLSLRIAEVISFLSTGNELIYFGKLFFNLLKIFLSL